MTRALAIVLLLAAPAAADPRAVAEKNFRAGERAYRAQNFEAAAQDFEEAYKAMPLPEIAFSAAQAHRRQYRVAQKPDDIARAMELYRVYLAAVKNGGRVRDAADAISELHREYEQLAQEGKLGKAAAAALTRLGVGVAFADQTEHHALEEVGDEPDSTGPGIKVEATIDGTPVEPNAFKSVEPGVHVIHVTAPGYLPADKKVNAIAASSDMVDIELQPKPAKVVVATEEGARISIDGRQLGVAPVGAIDVAPGKHLLTIAHDGRELAGRDLEVTRGQDVQLAVPLVSTTRRRLVPWFVGAAGAATLLCGLEVGLAFYYQHEARADFQNGLMPGDRAPSALDNYNSDREWRDRHEIAAWTMGGAAIVIGATAAWLYYFDKPSSEGVRVTPTGVAGHF